MSVRFWSLAVLSALAAFAQTDQGTITGTVVDANGGHIANAIVTAVHTSAGNVYRTSSSGTGKFTLPSVPEGDYVMTGDSPGFRNDQKRRVTLPAGQTLVFDLVLDINAACGGEVSHLPLSFHVRRSLRALLPRF